MAKKAKSANFFNKIIVLALAVISLALITVATTQKQTNYDIRTGATYNPKIDPDDFTTNITNKYFTLPVGKKMVYEGDTEEGRERIEITIPGDKKKIMGVETLLYRDKAWLDSNGDGKWSKKEMIEDTRDYLAQNKKTGDVWYFGEEVNNYEDGELIDHDGSWLAGDDRYPGALPGIWVKQNPKVGEVYLQEFYKGKAEDTVKVLSTHATVKTSLGKFKDCLRTKDFTPLEPDALENKYYCPNAVIKNIGSTVLIKDLANDEQLELSKLTVGKTDDDKDDEDDDKDNDRDGDEEEDD
ncbi:hypothetical protein A2715_03610 [Candidatus Woesebacteria bacterium RIFCSPHIGHO2_01_FULL_39_32]|uniref:Uncharacterized protein n=1 Tax=Candidatus Woesebacteria bacterium RIFCSPLOWO2_01_FULL_39_25 TaxID=1802521 RepID=A0A1F8BKT9_9BACT|nr:MAG: hypothetical protein A2124_04915 [Candidatus Woesebacteria bacterium GWB1_37_5]OGM24827.1 MAG: hypothetical protein A2715_03610 [Candidatus Woesebacteria bacterium RIFCSPHIGHO2_01_FULL_39_32]OGM37148.1 MAG: hypothetical protein A3F01_05550 [Candidatus Woesebacteria bacterium RIFCSPHIGHO2_12_FULL_38_11]OGM64653.1 MAG: hypothetical protein A2893_06525 [Candidatus Woesebacteria bacterium RIFCSPLOWO2_01_FULL_39_25]